MRIAHIAIVSPHRSGLYETTRDTVAAERAIGLDARILDPKRISMDRRVPVGNDSFAAACDVLVNHSGIGRFAKLDKPIVHSIHGRPRSSFILENKGVSPVCTFMREKANDPQYKAFVTYWPRHVPYWEMFLCGQAPRCVPAPVDIETWTPKGPSGYKFHGKMGSINILVADMWREDKEPFDVLVGAWHFARKHKGTKVHIYGIGKRPSGVLAILAALKQIDALGEVYPMVKGLDNIYRAASMLITPHTIATRTMREAMACGCPVVAADGNAHAAATADIEDPVAFAGAMEDVLDADYTREAARMYAEQHFDSKKTAEALRAIYEEVTDGSG